MKHKAINYEILFFAGSRFSEKKICRKKCSNSACRFQLHDVIRRGKVFFNSYINFIEGSSLENVASSPEIVPAEKFIHLSVGDVFRTTEYMKTINAYSFFPSKHFN